MMSTPETEGKETPHASVPSALVARELPSAVNSKELLDAHFSETGGKVIDSCGRRPARQDLTMSATFSSKFVLVFIT